MVKKSIKNNSNYKKVYVLTRQQNFDNSKKIFKYTDA